VGTHAQEEPRNQRNALRYAVRTPEHIRGIRRRCTATHTELVIEQQQRKM